jgi:sugar/nucleoside kinase (ribokinase family)
VTVLCVGLTTLDVVHHLDAPPVRGRKQRSVGGELVAGGPAANAAVTAAGLLGSARLLTGVGAGPSSAAALADLAAYGVEVLDLAPPDWPLPVASALVEVHSGERTVVSPGALGAGGLDLPPGMADEALEPVLAGVAAVLLDGHHPALAARVAGVATRARVPVVLDAGSWKDEMAAVLPRVTVAACSADLTPPGGRRAGDDPDGVATLMHRHGVPTVLVTDGPRPIAWSTLDGGRGRVEVPAVPAVDTLGAGDVFHGALLAAIAAGVTGTPARAELAARVAATRCARLGARAWLDEPVILDLAARLRGRIDAAGPSGRRGRRGQRSGRR